MECLPFGAKARLQGAANQSTIPGNLRRKPACRSVAEKGRGGGVVRRSTVAEACAENLVLYIRLRTSQHLKL